LKNIQKMLAVMDICDEEGDVTPNSKYCTGEQ
jgi:hypothetical protein